MKLTSGLYCSLYALSDYLISCHVSTFVCIFLFVSHSFVLISMKNIDSTVVSFLFFNLKYSWSEIGTGDFSLNYYVPSRNSLMF